MSQTSNKRRLRAPHVYVSHIFGDSPGLQGGALGCKDMLNDVRDFFRRHHPITVAIEDVLNKVETWQATWQDAVERLHEVMAASRGNTGDALDCVTRCSLQLPRCFSRFNLYKIQSMMLLIPSWRAHVPKSTSPQICP